MNYDQFFNLSCYEELEIQSTLMGISKVVVLKEIGHRIDDYYFFISNDGIFNWYDLDGNHIEDPGILKEIKVCHIPQNITKCIIPDNVISIGDYAFSSFKSLTSIVISNSVTNIGINAFAFCGSLKEITISNSVTCISIGTFAYCKSLKEITIPDTVINIDKYAFPYCESLTSITLSNNVISIGINAFSHCKSLKEVVFEGKTLAEVKQMENYPFGIEDESIIKCELR